MRRDNSCTTAKEKSGGTVDAQIVIAIQRMCHACMLHRLLHRSHFGSGLGSQFPVLAATSPQNYGTRSLQNYGTRMLHRLLHAVQAIQFSAPGVSDS